MPARGLLLTGLTAFTALPFTFRGVHGVHASLSAHSQARARAVAGSSEARSASEANGEERVADQREATV